MQHVAEFVEEQEVQREAHAERVHAGALRDQQRAVPREPAQEGETKQTSPEGARHEHPRAARPGQLLESLEALGHHAAKRPAGGTIRPPGQGYTAHRPPT